MYLAHRAVGRQFILLFLIIVIVTPSASRSVVVIVAYRLRIQFPRLVRGDQAQFGVKSRFLCGQQQGFGLGTVVEFEGFHRKIRGRVLMPQQHNFGNVLVFLAGFQQRGQPVHVAAQMVEFDFFLTLFLHQIVHQTHAMTRSNRFDFVFAVGVESNVGNFVVLGGWRKVDDLRFSVEADKQFAARVRGGQADDERTEHSRLFLGIFMGHEKVALLVNQQFVQMSRHRFSLDAQAGFDLLDDGFDKVPPVVVAESDSVLVDFPGTADGRVQHRFASLAKGRFVGRSDHGFHLNGVDGKADFVHAAQG